MAYTFVRIHRKNTGEYGVWYMRPNSVKDIIDHWKTVCAYEIGETVRHHLSGATYGENGAVMWPHPTTSFGAAVQAWCEANNQIYALGLVDVENEAYRSRIETFNNGMTIYLKEGMTVLLLDDRFFEIVEEVESDKLVYPSKKDWDMGDIRYMQWNMLGNTGDHWYAKIGKRDVYDKEGRMKWDTKAEAENAARWFIDNKLKGNTTNLQNNENKI